MVQANLRCFINDHRLTWDQIEVGQVYNGYFMDFDKPEDIDIESVLCKVLYKTEEEIGMMIPYKEDLFKAVCGACGKTTDFSQADYWENPKLTEIQYLDFDESSILIWRNEEGDGQEFNTIHLYPCYFLPPGLNLP